MFLRCKGKKKISRLQTFVAKTFAQCMKWIVLINVDYKNVLLWRW